MEIRFAKEKDIPKLLELLKQIKDIHQKGRPDLFKLDKPKYSFDELKKIISSKNYKYFVIVDDNDLIIGYCLCQIKIIRNDAVLNDSINFYIDDLCIDETFRNKGFGEKLYKHVLNYAKNYGANILTLNVWSCNEHALEFYKKMGLTPYKISMEQKLN